MNDMLQVKQINCLETLSWFKLPTSPSFSNAAFQTEGKLYLILDFLRGGDLFTRLSKEVS